jgi:N-acetyl sugar amidotransferase
MAIGSITQGRRVRHCTRCIMPDTRPRVVFDAEGVCNACHNADEKNRIDWDGRRAEFARLIEPYRSTDGRWDCIVPWSGGKDSSTIAFRLKHEFGMNPLLVTFSPLIPNEVGNANREALIQNGFDHVFCRPSQKVMRHFSRRFFIERGNPKVAWDAGINATPVALAVATGIPLVFYAEHGESEYGGRVLREESKRIRDVTEVIEHQIGDDPMNWVDEVVSAGDLNPYRYPATEDLARVNVKALYFAYFFRWSMADNFDFIRQRIPFATHPLGRTPGTFTSFDSLDDKSDNLYYYMQYIKFGFGRAVRDACRFIQNGRMTREEALEVARRFDGEFPEEHLDDMLDYMRMTRAEFATVVDRHRNPELWAHEDGEWTLRYPVA